MRPDDLDRIYREADGSTYWSHPDQCPCPECTSSSVPDEIDPDGVEEFDADEVSERYEAKEIGKFWYVYDALAEATIGTWIVGRMPRSREECEDAARRLNQGATIQALPIYGQNMARIVARAPWGDVYSAQDAEDGYIPSEAYYTDDDE